jgi:S1-C subfamily serine protease
VALVWQPSTPSDESAERSNPASSEPLTPEPNDESDAASGGAEPGGRRRLAWADRTERVAARQGIFVSRAAVRAAVRAGVRPSAVPVAANDQHPAGLLVTGCAGSALRDGDVVTAVGGRAPSSIEDVIAAVASAYKNKVYSISGQFWRDGEPWNAVVELPEPPEKPQTQR